MVFQYYRETQWIEEVEEDLEEVTLLRFQIKARFNCLYEMKVVIIPQSHKQCVGDSLTDSRIIDQKANGFCIMIDLLILPELCVNS